MQVSFPVAMLCGGIFAMLSSVVLLLPAFRLRGQYFILASMGVTIVTGNLAENFRSFTHGDMGLRSIPAFTNIWWTYGILVAVIYCIHRLMESKYGRALAAISRDPELAGVMGIDIARYTMLSFAVGSFITGVGAVLWVGVAQLLSWLVDRAARDTARLTELQRDASQWLASQEGMRRERRTQVQRALAVAGPVLAHTIAVGGHLDDTERQLLAASAALLSTLPGDATRANTTPSNLATANPAMLRALIDRLHEALRHDSPDALALVRDNAPLLSVALGPHWPALKRQVTAFDFAAALATLETLQVPETADTSSQP